MDKKLEIALIYSNNENWIGGTYYIQNVLHALNSLPDKDKPFVHVLCQTEKEYQHLLGLCPYPFTTFVLFKRKVIPISFFQKVLNKIFYNFKNIYKMPSIRLEGLDLALPVFPFNSNGLHNDIAWIPDFQEKYFPEFFSKDELNRRYWEQKRISRYAKKIVFSSQDAQKDFDKFFPESKIKKYVIPFAVSLQVPQIEELTIETLFEKYEINGDYFMLSNQFWQHKNHFLVLKALQERKQKGLSKILILVTGKENDPRNPEYSKSIRAFIEEHGLWDQIRLLGFIDRNEQLALLKHAKALIQPSLFEGWNTSIEDAKFLNKPVIASDIAVHREQLGEKGFYAKPNLPSSFNETLDAFLLQDIDTVEYAYAERIIEFGQNLRKMFLD